MERIGVRRPWVYLRVGSAGGPRAGLAAAAHAREALPLVFGNPFGDGGLAALLAPPPPAGTPPPPAGGLKKLEYLDLDGTQITDAGCAALAAVLDRGMLPALVTLELALAHSSPPAPRRKTR